MDVSCPTLFYENLLNLSKLPGQRDPEVLLRSGIAAAHCYPSLYVGPGDPNSGSPACTASTPSS